jgi:RNA polymerase sigma-54 factor
MALEQKLRLKLAQRLVMTPSLQQAIKLLQLSRLELEEALTQEILENPILDVEEQPEESQQVDGEGAEQPSEGEERETAGAQTEGDQDQLPSPEETYDDIDVEAFFADYLSDFGREGPSMVTFSPDSEVPLENVLSAAPGLYDHLLWQLHLLDCPEDLVDVCEFIIGNLDEDGYLRASDEEIIRATDATPVQVSKGLSTVRSLDPPGIAARDLQECLLSQIEQLIETAVEDSECGPLELARRVVADHWKDFLHQRWERLAESVGCAGVTDLKPVLDIIHRLEPKPGRIYTQERNQYIEPDVYVRKVDGEYSITLNDDGLPRLRINSRYARMLEGQISDPQVNNYLREKMRNAVWLMKSIDQRQRTIYKVARSIVSFQRGFLDH